MNRTPDIHRDLARVGMLKRSLLEGQPSNRALSRAAGLSATTIGQWLKGKDLPRDLSLLLKVLAMIRAEAHRRGLLEAPAEVGAEDTIDALLDAGRWRASWQAKHDARVESSSQAAELGRSHAALQAQEMRTRRAALADPARPVRTWDAQRLGVHPAIPGHRTDGRDPEFVLPRYVPRPHDEKLREHLRAALDPRARPLLAVVRGGSCTGKTRTAYEAVAAVIPDDFDLFFPADAAGLLQAVAADAIGPGTVLWLNEAQTYLDGAEGEAVAASLVRLLNGEGPLAVIATLWPDHDAAFTSRPVPGKADKHPRTRALLAQARYTHVPDFFTDDLKQARQVRDLDASLAVALDTGGDHLTQTLAAGPDLVDHYEHPTGRYGVYGRALISAVMDADRLGITAPFPYALLEAAAPGYLTPAERAAAPEDWFGGALAYARTRVKHVVAPLMDVPRPSGMGAVPGVVTLADYLRQHGRRNRRLMSPPTSFWDAATEHLTDPFDLWTLAMRAADRMRLLHAARLFCAVADRGEAAGLAYLAMWRMTFEGMGTDAPGGAERFYQAAENASSNPFDYDASARGASGLEGAGPSDQDTADSHGSTDWVRQAEARRKDGDLEGAELMAWTAIAANDPNGFIYLARLSEWAKDVEGAERFAGAVADAGDLDTIVALLTKHSMLGDYGALRRLVRYGFTAEGDPEEPWEWPEPRLLSEGGGGPR